VESVDLTAKTAKNQGVSRARRPRDSRTPARIYRPRFSFSRNEDSFFLFERDALAFSILAYECGLCRTFAGTESEGTGVVRAESQS
jgi:hypothetical protein